MSAASYAPMQLIEFARRFGYRRLAATPICRATSTGKYLQEFLRSAEGEAAANVDVHLERVHGEATVTRAPRQASGTHDRAGGCPAKVSRRSGGARVRRSTAGREIPTPRRCAKAHAAYVPDPHQAADRAAIGPHRAADRHRPDDGRYGGCGGGAESVDVRIIALSRHGLLPAVAAQSSGRCRAWMRDWTCVGCWPAVHCANMVAAVRAAGARGVQARAAATGARPSRVRANVCRRLVAEAQRGRIASAFCAMSGSIGIRTVTACRRSSPNAWTRCWPAGSCRCVPAAYSQLRAQNGRHRRALARARLPATCSRNSASIGWSIAADRRTVCSAPGDRLWRQLIDAGTGIALMRPDWVCARAVHGALVDASRPQPAERSCSTWVRCCAPIIGKPPRSVSCAAQGRVPGRGAGPDELCARAQRYRRTPH
jgi:hypothetical protein